MNGKMNPAAHRARLLRRFHASYEVSESGCWLWTASMAGSGYPKCSVFKKSVAAHRLGYEMMVGLIPPGLQLDHLCRTPRCVNPDHLEPVTPRENSLRSRGFAAVNAAKTVCKRGHALAEPNLYVFTQNGRLHRQCLACRRELRSKPRLFADPPPKPVQPSLLGDAA